LIVLDFNAPNLNPCHNILNNLVFSGNADNIIMTIVDGKVLYKNGEFLSIDVEKANYEAEQERKRILGKL
jgi:5-methylthioadenosine/S-adenosylhomocysteine deaminase